MHEVNKWSVKYFWCNEKFIRLRQKLLQITKSNRYFKGETQKDGLVSSVKLCRSSWIVIDLNEYFIGSLKKVIAFSIIRVKFARNQLRLFFIPSFDFYFDFYVIFIGSLMINVIIMRCFCLSSIHVMLLWWYFEIGVARSLHWNNSTKESKRRESIIKPNRKLHLQKTPR